MAQDYVPPPPWQNNNRSRKREALTLNTLSREERIAWAVIDCAYYHEINEAPDVEAIFADYGLRIVDEAADG
jgi:hypothetical protein